MYLINSKLVSASQNIFWESLPKSWHSLTSRNNLVLTLPYHPGSAEEQTLLKMLGACKLAADQYHILSIEPGQQIAWHKIQEALQPKNVLLLGVSPQDLGISALFRLHEPNPYQECIFIPALAVAQWDQFPEAKKEFWIKGLKPTFVP